MGQPKISVVIPAYNEATYIDRLLNALSEQSYTDFEVVVSDAQSEDDTAKIVEDFKDRLEVKMVSAPPKGPGFGRNRGADVARGEWLLFMDADVDVEDPEYLMTLLEETEKHGWNTSSARMRVASKKFKFRSGVWAFYHWQKLLAHTKHPVAQGYCIFTRRSIFNDHQGFNEKIMLGEDNDYVSRVGKHGFGFVDETYYFVDLRRNEDMGFKYTYKAMMNEITRVTGLKSPESNRYAYDFGKHKPRAK
jgi:glycosyltransferase involved in cell wall biosynthesis